MARSRLVWAGTSSLQGVVRSEGLEPPRFYSLPPQGSASTNSATSAREIGTGLPPDRINGADVTNQGWGDKACERSVSGTDNGRIEAPGSAGTRRFRQHLLDFDRNPVAIDQHYPAGDRQIVGEDLDLVRLGGIQFDDGAPAQTHYLMNRHRRGPEDHHEVDADFIEGWHWGPGLTDKCKIAWFQITTLWLANG